MTWTDPSSRDLLTLHSPSQQPPVAVLCVGLPNGSSRELRSHSVWKLRTCSLYVDRSTAERTALHLSGSLRGRRKHSLIPLINGPVAISIAFWGPLSCCWCFDCFAYSVESEASESIIWWKGIDKWNGSMQWFLKRISQKNFQCNKKFDKKCDLWHNIFIPWEIS